MKTVVTTAQKKLVYQFAAFERKCQLWASHRRVEELFRGVGKIEKLKAILKIISA